MKHLIALTLVGLSTALLAESVPTLKLEFSPLVGKGVLRGVSPDAQFAVFASKSSPSFVVVSLRTRRIERTIPVPQIPPRTSIYETEIEISADTLPVAFSPDSSTLLVGKANGFIEEYSLSGGSPLCRKYSDSQIVSLATIQPPAGNPLLFVASVKAVSVFDLATKIQLCQFSGTGAGKYEEHYLREQFSSMFDGSGAHALLASWNGIRLFDIQSGTEQGPFLPHDPTKNAPLITAGFNSKVDELIAVFARATELIFVIKPIQGIERAVVHERTTFFTSHRTVVSNRGRILVPAIPHWDNGPECVRLVETGGGQSSVQALTDSASAAGSVAITEDGQTAVVYKDEDELLQVWWLP